jgi:hypothetical protein
MNSSRFLPAAPAATAARLHGCDEVHCAAGVHHVFLGGYVAALQHNPQDVLLLQKVNQYNHSTVSLTNCRLQYYLKSQDG